MGFCKKSSTPREAASSAMWGVARDEKDGHGRRPRVVPLAVAELAAVHAGHPQVEDDAIGPGPLLELVQGLLPIGGLADPVALALQQQGEQLAGEAVVIYHQ
jgi:hypothetical protein